MPKDMFNFQANSRMHEHREMQRAMENNNREKLTKKKKDILESITLLEPYIYHGIADESDVTEFDRLRDELKKVERLLEKK